MLIEDERRIFPAANISVEDLREQWTLILEKLFVENQDFTATFLIGDAGDDEIPAPVRNLRDKFLTINFWHDGSIGEMEVKDGLLCFTAPFYSTLGSDYYLAVKLERIAQLRVFPMKPPAEDRRRGLRAV